MCKHGWFVLLARLALLSRDRNDRKNLRLPKLQPWEFSSNVQAQLVFQQKDVCRYLE